MEAPRATPRTRLESIVGSGALALSIALAAWLVWVRARPRVVGQFIEDGFIEFSLAVPLMFLFAIGAAAWVWAAKHGRWATAIGLAATIVAGVSADLPLTWEGRFAQERGRLEQALRSGQPYGAQFEGEFRGRKATYWMWWRSGVDNAVGVMHLPGPPPPTDVERLTDEERRLFHRETHGIIIKVQPLRPNWYLVTHT